MKAAYRARQLVVSGAGGVVRCFDHGLWRSTSLVDDDRGGQPGISTSRCRCPSLVEGWQADAWQLRWYRSLVWWMGWGSGGGDVFVEVADGGVEAAAEGVWGVGRQRVIERVAAVDRLDLLEFRYGFSASRRTCLG